jgi:two-component system osmolarity sensor histidine kinase EnvZ
LVLVALLGFLVLLSLAATTLLRYSALQPSVRQLALPLTAVLHLVDAADAGSHSAEEAALRHEGIVRAPAARASAAPLPVPFLDALAEYLRTQTGRQVQIERSETGATRLWMQTARGDFVGVPLEPLRTLVAQFALLIALIGLGLAVLAAWWLARRLSAPIERLAAVAARLPEPVAASDFRVRGPREVQLLGAQMATALERIERQRRERELLLAGLSHDLRTPLMRLLLRIDLLDHIGESEREALGAEIHELDRRIDRFIEHARTGAEEPVVSLDLTSLVQPAIAASRARGHQWTTTLVSSASLRGQPGVLARLIANLLDNAEQHGVAPFALALTAQTDAAARPGWQLVISNARADEPRSLGVAPHRGFGLALCQQIARAHGGDLLIDHAHADGFRAALWLPAESLAS